MGSEKTPLCSSESWGRGSAALGSAWGRFSFPPARAPSDATQQAALPERLPAYEERAAGEVVDVPCRIVLSPVHLAQPTVPRPAAPQRQLSARKPDPLRAVEVVDLGAGGRDARVGRGLRDQL